MKKTFFTVIYILVLHSFSLYSQSLPEPTDYLTKEFHKQQREALRKLMPENSVTVIFAYPERVFSQDINYVYHQNPDLYYFSGYQEPNAVLLIFKETQHAGDSSYNELFFVQKRDPRNETWTGKRLGAEGTRSKLGFEKVYIGKMFDSICPDLSKFNVIYENIPDDISDDNEAGNLYNLYKTFQKKANTPDKNHAKLISDLNMIAQYAMENYLDEYINYLMPKVKNDSAYGNNEFIQQIMKHPDSSGLEKIKSNIKLTVKKSGPLLFANLASTLREIKMPEELALIRKAVFISSVAHAEAMKAIQPNMSERDQGVRDLHPYTGACCPQFAMA